MFTAINAYIRLPNAVYTNTPGIFLTLYALDTLPSSPPGHTFTGKIPAIDTEKYLPDCEGTKSL